MLENSCSSLRRACSKVAARDSPSLGSRTRHAHAWSAGRKLPHLTSLCHGIMTARTALQGRGRVPPARHCFVTRLTGFACDLESRVATSRDSGSYLLIIRDDISRCWIGSTNTTSTFTDVMLPRAIPSVVAPWDARFSSVVVGDVLFLSHVLGLCFGTHFGSHFGSFWVILGPKCDHPGRHLSVLDRVD